MSRIIVLDSGPLGLLSNPSGGSTADECWAWVIERLTAGDRMIVPEIADYEVRRELIRAGKSRSIARLDQISNDLEYLPLTTSAMREAARLWAEVRSRGRKTADDKALDGDVILAAQALSAKEEDDDLVVATTNPGHLSLFLEALPWHEIA